MYGFTNNFISVKIDNIFLFTLVIIPHVDALIFIFFESNKWYDKNVKRICVSPDMVSYSVRLRLTEYDAISGSTQTV